MRGICFAALAAVLCPAAWGQAPVTVVEEKIQATLRDGSTFLTFPVESTLDHAAGANLSAAWIGTNDQVLGSAQKDIVVSPGYHAIEIPLRLPESSIWLRLRYSLTPARMDTRAFATRQGIVALSSIAAHIFELKVSHIGAAVPGSRLVIDARALHPVTHLPVSAVRWKASLAADDQEITPVRVTSEAAGFQEFEFEVPTEAAGGNSGGAAVVVTAEKGDFSQSVSARLDIPDRPSARIQTDKPIYQPGQTIHFRAIVLDPQGHAYNSAKVTLRIDDDQSDRVHTARLTSSQFGVISDDWTLPASASLGLYALTLTADGDDEYQIASHTVRISRYELPMFNVQVKPDRPAYLPGEEAHVAVTGIYLFGKPVARAHVKVERSEGSTWNAAARRFEVADQAVASGEAGDDGTFVASLDLKRDQNELQKQGNQRFQDLHFAAYVTDPSSRRTEQRRFDVRITRQPIHIYLTVPSDGGPLPAPVYVATDYADGEPAMTTVELRYHGQVAQVRTDSYGVGKADFIGSDSPVEEMQVRATDSRGLSGDWTERIWFNRSRSFRVEVGRTFYRAGDAVKLRIIAPPGEDSPGDAVMVSAVANDRMVTNQVVQLVNGKAEVVFPYRPEFLRTVTFVVWSATDPQARAFSQGLASRSVIYPAGSDLRLTARTAKAVYRPGEPARLDMQVRSTDGQPVQAEVGVAVVDQAVLERARTDREFGERPWFSCNFCADAGDAEIGGVSLNDLYDWKPARPIPPGLDLVAEALAARSSAYVLTESSEGMETAPAFRAVRSQMDQIRAALDKQYAATLQFPKDESALSRIPGIQWYNLQDPWGVGYTAEFQTERTNDVVRLVSAGPDKRRGTADDFVAGTFQHSYMAPLQALIEQALKQHKDFPASLEELRGELSGAGLLLDSLQDPWGTAYRASILTFGRTRRVSLMSAGPDRHFGTADDFLAAAFAGTYFERERQRIETALRKAGTPPRSLQDFENIVNASGVDISRFLDPWGKPYRLTSISSTRYGDRTKSTTVQVFGQAPAAHSEVIPVTRRFVIFTLRSAGPDGIENTYDDFDVASFPVLLSEESAQPTAANGTGQARLLPGTGVLAGVVTDASGAVVPNAKVLLIDAVQDTFEIDTDDDGAFRFVSLPSGVYLLRVTSSGFQIYEVRTVPVTDGKSTAVNVVLQVGAAAESVTVEADAPLLNTEAASVAVNPTATPRVRDYFPETLLWLPGLLTDEHGGAHAKFRLADSVTTWKAAVIASTLDGRIAETETDLRSFQPFFLDFSPPPVLTQGDRIDLPVTVRNYTERQQRVRVSWLANDWSKVQGPAGANLAVASNQSANAVFAIQAGALSGAARQRIVASAGREKDAIEKSIEVHPDGQQVLQTFGDLVAGPTSLGLQIPAAAILGATQVELHLYPNVASMLFESAGAILNSPHGCAEQTISAGYAGLIALEYARAMGIHNPAVEKAALANVASARDSLAGFQRGDGGIAYWGNGPPDLAVSAYALTFLVDAERVTEIDAGVIDQLVSWLQKQQGLDGRWRADAEYAKSAGKRDLLLTGLVARSLAAARKAGIAVPTKILTAAYHHLAQFTDQTDEPYMLAQFVLAALDSGDEALLGDAANRLASLGRTERGGLYWDLRTNTPFYGWGTAGRLETTGLVISALSRWRARHPEQSGLDIAIRRGLVFLLRGRDHFGSWYSTQSTVRVMQAMTDAAGALGTIGGGGGKFEILVNGHPVPAASFPTGSDAVDPILVNLSQYMASGENHVELRPSAGTAGAVMLLTSVYWLPWNETQPKRSDELRLSVQFDRLDPRAGETVRCSVHAERAGFRGYGMMLAEIGLPPGAEVDRASLESVLDDSSVDLEKYEILPDRVILYLWPKSGGVSFDFNLSARISMIAKTAASVLYDYYNPEEATEIAPVAWSVK